MSTSFSSLTNEKLISVVVIRNHPSREDAIYFHCVSGKSFVMQHIPECCEQVHIEDIYGDIGDILNTPILVAEQRSVAWPSYAESERPPGLPIELECRDDSDTWTFYTIRTIKGTIDIRWHGSSSGNYSERVDFSELTDIEDNGT